MPAILTREIDVSAQPVRLHLDYLDGLRGLAALYVVFCHITVLTGRMPDAALVPHLWRPFDLLFSWGRGPVATFIVLSGYCLMLPVSKSATMDKAGTLRGGVAEFLKRRARRILPPYYAALVLSWILIALVPNTRLYTSAWPLFTPKVVISHLLLLHNLSPNWANKINGALWSVATEWQIYFVFALLLLPVYRKFGIAVALIAATVTGIAPHFLLHRFDGASFQYITLFGLGMLAAEINFSPRVPDYIRRLPWNRLSSAALLLCLAFLWRYGHKVNTLTLDLVFGAVAAIFLTASTFALRSRTSSPALRLLSARPVVRLGAFSYSLYLVHDPLLYSCITVLRTHGASAAIVQPILICLLPLIVAAAYLFHLAFERPFMSKPGQSAPRTERQAEVAAIVNPAP